MVGVDVGGTHGSSLGGRGFRLAARGFGDYRSGSVGSDAPVPRAPPPATLRRRRPEYVSCGWSSCLSVRRSLRSKAPSTTTPTCNATCSGPKLYACGGTTLYCGLPFAAGEKSVDGRDLTIEHAYPADWIATHLGCENRKSCKVEAYGRAAADLHNLWPAITNINSSRQDQSLGEIPGEQQRRFQDYCPDYERTKGPEAIIEPRDAVKGDMARSILYMLEQLPVAGPANLQRDMLLRWHEQDPPDDTERWRNFVIEGLQGTANPYIP